MSVVNLLLGVPALVLVPVLLAVSDAVHAAAQVRGSQPAADEGSVVNAEARFYHPHFHHHHHPHHPHHSHPSTPSVSLSARPATVTEAPDCSCTFTTVDLPEGAAVRFQSPNYPQRYPSRTRCGWRFETTAGGSIDVECSQIAMTWGDYFKILSWGSQRVSYSGTSQQNVTHTFTSNAILVMLNSGRGRTAEGFSCVVWRRGAASASTASTSAATTPTVMTDTTTGGTTVPGIVTSTTSTGPSTIPTTSTSSATTSASTTTTSSPTSTTSTTTTASTTSTTDSANTASSQRTCLCGVSPTRRIVGGVVADEGAHPWIVSLGVGLQQFCGGVLISDAWILTAAHCISSRLSSVGIGYHTLNAPSSYSISRTVRETIVHADYVADTYLHDIALVRIDPISWSDLPEIRPVCLPDDLSDLYVGESATVAGWGTTSSGGSSSVVLREVDVPVLSNSDCRSAYGSAVTDEMVCAGVESGGKDSCQGDSGGPLTITDGTNVELVGIVSWGNGCALPGFPGVYTRVTSYYSWITSRTGTNFCPRS